MKTVLWVLLSVAALSAADPGKAGMDAARLARIGPRMKAFVDQGKAAGIVTIIQRHGVVADVSVSGYLDLEKKTPMKVDSLFRIASCTKPITATAVMILAEEGLLAITDPVEKYLPEFRDKKILVGDQLVKPSRLITLRDLLTHTSGLPGGGPAVLDDGGEKMKRTLAEVVALESQLPLSFEPGTKWQYSNVGLATLGRIVEVVAGQPYDQFLAERIFGPLGMRDTFFFVTPDKESRVATIYTDEKGVLKDAGVGLNRKGVAKYPAPEGGLYSTAGDLARFYQMMLNKGALDGKRILSQAGVQLMTTVQTGDLTAGFAPGIGYGLGFAIVRNTDGVFRMSSIGSFGHGGAYRTYTYADPGKDMVGVIMLQRTNGGGDMADEISAFMTMAAAAIQE
jgi:CubicO group peptidase (beta-lactamase class C family)